MTQDVVTWLAGGITQIDEEWAGAAPSIYLLGVAIIGATLLLTIAILTWRGKEFKWDWLIYLLCGAGLIIFSILYFVYGEPTNPYAIFGVTVEDAMVSFAPIGILIAGCLAVVAFVLDKFVGRE